MKKNSAWVLFFSLLVSCSYAADDSPWKNLPVILAGETVRAVVEDPQDPKRVYLMTTNGLLTFTSRPDSLARLPRRLFDQGGHDLFISEDGREMWAATDKGLFMSIDRGKTWRNRITRDKVLSVLVERGKIFVGGENGLSVVKPHNEIAFRIPGDLGRVSIQSFRRTSQGILAVTPDSVYLLRSGRDMAEMILKVSGEDEGAVENNDASTEEERERAIFIRAVEVIEGVVYVVSTEGIFRGELSSLRWEELPSEGVLLDGVTSLAFVRGRLGDLVMCVGGKQGVQCQLDGAWVSVGQGLASSGVVALKRMSSGDLLSVGAEVASLSAVNKEKLMALANMIDPAQCQFRSYASLQQSFRDEPSVGQVQKMAVRYSDTDKAKIDAWKSQARLRAFLPSFSVGVDRTGTDKYHWDSGPNPDVLMKGKEYRDWDVSLSWDLGDVIWSTDQTSIDSRSKLMVELREQLLDQVTRLYFERRRLQIELASCRYPSEGERMAVEMRVDELTAHIDAYTGGEFVKKVNHRSNT